MRRLVLLAVASVSLCVTSIFGDEITPVRVIKPKLGEREGRPIPLKAVAYNSDGSQLAVAAKDAIRIFDVKSGDHLQNIAWEGPDFRPSMVFSDDGKHLFTAGGLKPLRTYELASGKLVGEFATETRCVAFTPNATRVLMRPTGLKDDPFIGCQVFSLPQLQPLTSFQVDFGRGGAYMGGISRNGKLAAFSTMTGGKVHDKPHIFVLNVDKNQLWCEFAHDPKQTVIALSPSGRMLAAVGQNGQLKFFDVANRREAKIPLLDNMGFPVTPMTFSPDERRLVHCSTRSEVLVIDVASATVRGRLTRTQFDSVMDVAISPDGKTLAQASRNDIRFWAMEDLEAAAP